mgnify:CR=1 FL=1
MRVLRFAALASCASSLGKGPIGVKMVDVAGDGAALVVDSYADAAVLVDVVRCAVLGVRLLDAGARAAKRRNREQRRVNRSLVRAHQVANERASKERIKLLEQAILSKFWMLWQTLVTFLREPSSIMACKISMTMHSMKFIEAIWRNSLMEKSFEEKMERSSSRKDGSHLNLLNLCNDFINTL